MYQIKLYITGSTANSEKAISNLTRFLNDEFEGQFRLQIVDIISDPDSADEDHIFATPTVVKAEPLPVRRIIGDLSDKKRVLGGLGMPQLG